MEPRTGDIAELGDPWLVLEELDGVEIVERLVVHVERGHRDGRPVPVTRNSCSRPTTSTADGPRELPRAVVSSGQPHEVAGAIADQRHGEVVERRADHLAQPWSSGGSELDVTVLRKEVEQARTSRPHPPVTTRSACPYQRYTRQWNTRSSRRFWGIVSRSDPHNTAQAAASPATRDSRYPAS